MDVIKETLEDVQEGIPAEGACGSSAAGFSTAEPREPKKLKIDKKKLIIYSEIMRPKFEE